MGIRSLTHVFDDGKPILCLYRQFDGYPNGHGAEVAAILSSAPFVNGIRDEKPCFNGMGCFAAQLVAALKTKPGGFYLFPMQSKDCGEKYVYEVHGGFEKPVTVKCTDTVTTLYNGDIAGFVEFCKKGSE